MSVASLDIRCVFFRFWAIDGHRLPDLQAGLIIDLAFEDLDSIHSLEPKR